MNPIEYFVDRCLGRFVCSSLRAVGAVVHAHDDHFPPDTLDSQWLPIVGSMGWVVVSKDFRIRTNPLERLALQAAGIRAFILKRGDLRGEEMAALFLRHLPAMDRMARELPAPFVVRISASKLTRMSL